MIFKDYDGQLVKLDRSVPGDATCWYVASFWKSFYPGMEDSWIYEDATREPGELIEFIGY